MIVPVEARPRTSAVQQWWVLTARSIVPTLRNGELVTAIAASVIVTAGFYIPLNQVMGKATDGLSSYAQFLTPLIVLQGISFASISGAFRAATDATQGINRRFGSMPLAAATPFAARMSASLYRCSIGLTIAVACGYVIGFRFHRGPGDVVGFCLLVLLVGMTLSLLADVIGTSAKNPESTTPLLMGPQLIFGLLSVGIQPAERFPEWIQPVVRNQPISQWVYALRALAGDSSGTAPEVAWALMRPSLLWLLGLLMILVPLAAVVLVRRRS